MGKKRDVWADLSKDGRFCYVMPIRGHKAYTGKEEVERNMV